MDAQDFQKLRKLYYARKQLYEDPDFPAVASNLFYQQKPQLHFEWKRPKDIVANPKFIIDSWTQYDVCKGSLGENALVAALGVLYQYRSFFYRVVPANQGFSVEDEYAGIFYFWFWWAGEWKEVIIDDRLPTVNGKLVFIQPQKTSQLWAALLEKAYAKLHGSYEALKFATSMDILNDLTGGSTEVVSLSVQNKAAFDILCEALETRTICTAVAIESSSTNEDLTENHISIVGIKSSLNDNSDAVHIKLPPPNGGGKDNKGTEEEVWMSWSEVCNNYNRLEIVHLDADICQSEQKFRNASLVQTCSRIYQGCWRKGVTAGGCRNNTDTFHANCQLMLATSQSTDVIIALLQHQILVPRVMGISVYKIPDDLVGKLLRADFFRTTKALFHSSFANTRQIVCRLPLEVGHYAIIPCTYQPGEEGAFTMRVYSRGTITLGMLDTPPAITKQPIIEATNDNNDYYNMFATFADEKETVNAYELQELLQNSLPNDYIKSCTNLDVCRKVVQSLNPNNPMGRIEYCHFKDFITSLKFWQEIFESYTKSTSGIMKAEKFRDALENVGFQLPTDVLHWLLLRFMRKDCTLRFGDFVAAILQLLAAFNNFARKDKDQKGHIQLNLRDWLKLVLRS